MTAPSAAIRAIANNLQTVTDHPDLQSQATLQSGMVLAADKIRSLPVTSPELRRLFRLSLNMSYQTVDYHVSRRAARSIVVDLLREAEVEAEWERQAAVAAGQVTKLPLLQRFRAMVRPRPEGRRSMVYVGVHMANTRPRSRLT